MKLHLFFSLPKEVWNFKLHWQIIFTDIFVSVHTENIYCLSETTVCWCEQQVSDLLLKCMNYLRAELYLSQVANITFNGLDTTCDIVLEQAKTFQCVTLCTWTFTSMYLCGHQYLCRVLLFLDGQRLLFVNNLLLSCKLWLTIEIVFIYHTVNNTEIQSMLDSKYFSEAKFYFYFNRSRTLLSFHYISKIKA